MKRHSHEPPGNREHRPWLKYCVVLLSAILLTSCKPAEEANLSPDLQALLQQANQGDMNAQYLLAMRYRLGQGAHQDDYQALQWMTKAAEQGHPAAQYETGSYYLLPEYPDQNDVKAAYWLHRAAEQGYAPAQFSLAALYYVGRGVERDLIESYAWMNLAVANGDEDALGARNSIKEQLSAEEFEQAHERALRYQEKYSPHSQ
jgi:TPR repeat protein